MRFRKTLTFLLPATGLIFALSAWAEQKHVANAPAYAAAMPAQPPQAQQKPFTQEQVSNIVRAGLGDDSGAKLIGQRGIDFAPSEDFIQTLKAAGASEAFLNALRAAKRPETLTIDAGLVSDFYNDCMKRTANSDPSQAEAVCKLESTDPDMLKNYGKQDETGKLVPITDEDRAQDYAHCVSSPFGDTTDPVQIAYCREEAANNLYVHVFLSNPIRKVRKVYVANFRGAKKIMEAFRDTCIQDVDSAEQSDASLIQAVNLAKYLPDHDYDTVCSSNSVSVRCTDGVTTDTTNCGPLGDCVSTTRHTTFKTLALVDSHTGKELDWVEPVGWSKPSELVESLSKVVGCAKGKKPEEGKSK